MDKKKNKSTREKRRKMSNENKIEENNILGKKVEREKESKLKSKSNIIRILIEPIINKEKNKKVKNNEEKKGKIMNINKEKKERKKVDNTKKTKKVKIVKILKIVKKVKKIQILLLNIYFL